MGNNSDGFKNEKKFEKILDGKSKFSEINKNLQNFLKFLDPGVDDTSSIKSVNIKNNLCKPDIFIEINENKYYISVKKGSGNSVHQEKLEEFIRFLSVKKVSKDDIDNLRKFIWGDGTVDGTGLISERLSANELKKNLEFRDSIKNIFDLLKLELLERFLFVGKDSNIELKAEYIYYGIPEKGIWGKKSEILNYMRSIQNRDFTLANLTFQACNRDLEGKGNKDRDNIQLKWSTIKSDLKKC